MSARAAGATTSGAAETFVNNGQLIIGAASTFTVNGDYSQSGNGVLQIVIGGDASTNGALTVTGTANVGGRLDVRLANGFTPAPGQTFSIINAAGISGGFSQVTGATVQYTANGVTVHPTGERSVEVTSIARSGADQVLIEGKGIPGQVYLIKASSDLSSNYETLGNSSVTNSSGTWQYVDKPPAGVTKRFYRGFQP